MAGMNLPVRALPTKIALSRHVVDLVDLRELVGDLLDVTGNVHAHHRLLHGTELQRIGHRDDLRCRSWSGQSRFEGLPQERGCTYAD